MGTAGVLTDVGDTGLNINLDISLSDERRRQHVPPNIGVTNLRGVKNQKIFIRLNKTGLTLSL
jgi:hypothetical protein